MGREITRPQKEIDKAVERYLKGEDVNSLARQYGISRAGMYLWIKRAKNAATAKQRLADIGEKGVESEKRISKDLELKALRDDNDRLRKALFEMMVKHKEL